LFGRHLSPWLAIKDAQRAETMTVTGDDRRTGIKAEAVRTESQRVPFASYIGVSVEDDDRLSRFQRQSAKSMLSGRFRSRDADARLEPGASVVDQTDRCALAAKRKRCQPCDLVEVPLGRRIEDRHVPESGKPACLGRIAQGGGEGHASRMA
jgi:hypothetical protein